MIAATPTKLRNGSWGARTRGIPTPGDSVKITTKSGKSWVARVARVVWTDRMTTAIVATEEGSAPRRGGRRRKECVSGGNCSSFGNGRSCGGYDCDGY